MFDVPPLLEYSAALPGLSPGCSLSRAARLQGGQFTSLQDELNRPSGRSSAIQQDAHRRRAKSFPPGGSSGSQVSADRTCPDLGPRPGRAQAPALRPGGLTRVGFSHFLPWDAQILPLGTPFSGGKPSRWSEFTHTHV